MRNLIGVLLCAWLLAPASFAQEPTEQAKTATPPAAPPVRVELRLPSSVIQTLDGIAKALDERALADKALAEEKALAEKKRKSIHWLEKWAWLAEIFVLAGAAILFGWRDSGHAVQLETQTSDARTAQEGMRLNLPGAKDEFENIRTKTLGMIDEHNSRWTQWLYWVLAAISGGSLLALALLPDLVPPETPVLGIRVWVLRDAGWSVLDSNFATAFAGTWIALLYFWGSQNQRKKEADRVFSMVTKEAERIETALKAKAELDQFEKYERKFELVSSLIFEPPWSGAISDEDSAAFFEVAAASIHIGRKTKLTIANKQEDIRKETEQLTKLAEPPLLAKELDFLTLAKRLRRAQMLADPDWMNLINAATDDESKRATRSLAEQLKQQREKAESEIK